MRFLCHIQNNEYKYKIIEYKYKIIEYKYKIIEYQNIFFEFCNVPHNIFLHKLRKKIMRSKLRT